MSIIITPNKASGGYCSTFEHNGKTYYADLSPCMGLDECMIFPVKDGKTDFVDDKYCRRNVPVEPCMLQACIEEFIQGEENERD